MPLLEYDCEMFHITVIKIDDRFVVRDLSKFSNDYIDYSFAEYKDAVKKTFELFGDWKKEEFGAAV